MAVLPHTARLYNSTSTSEFTKERQSLLSQSFSRMTDWICIFWILLSSDASISCVGLTVPRLAHWEIFGQWRPGKDEGISPIITNPWCHYEWRESNVFALIFFSCVSKKCWWTWGIWKTFTHFRYSLSSISSSMNNHCRLSVCYSRKLTRSGNRSWPSSQWRFQ